MAHHEHTITGAATWRTPRELDVTSLPEVVFGHRAVAWWATVTFMVIEGTTLLVSLTAYFYLRRNFDIWPPPPTALPELTVPTISLIILLVMIIPMWYVGHATRKFDLRGVRIGLWISGALGLAAMVLRVFDFVALNVRWDEHAYGSIVWILVFLHATLLFVDVLETGAFLALTYSPRLDAKHFSDIEDASLYQYFLSLSWIPIYVVVYLSPRFL